MQNKTANMYAELTCKSWFRFTTPSYYKFSMMSKLLLSYAMLEGFFTAVWFSIAYNIHFQAQVGERWGQIQWGILETAHKEVSTPKTEVEQTSTTCARCSGGWVDAVATSVSDASPRKMRITCSKRNKKSKKEAIAQMRIYGGTCSIICPPHVMCRKYASFMCQNMFPTKVPEIFLHNLTWALTFS